MAVGEKMKDLNLPELGKAIQGCEEIEAPGKEWDPYDELFNDKSEDVLEELFALDDDCEDFAGF